MPAKSFFLILLLTVYCGLVSAAADPGDIDVLHYNFQVAVNDSNNIVAIKANLRFRVNRPLTRIWLDLTGQRPSGKGMLVKSVFLNGVPAEFRQVKDSLWLFFPTTLSAGSESELNVEYQGIPTDGLIYSLNKYGHRTIFSDNWPDRAHNWLVCRDQPSDKASVDFEVTAPDHYQVIANGVKLEETNLKNHFRYTHWQETVPLPTTVMAIGLADFAVALSGQVQNIPVYSWVFPDDRTNGFIDYSEAMPVLSFYMQKIGPYPYKKLANVQSKTIFGGMENASCIFYEENLITGTKKYRDLIAHEVAHQWFGNSVTESAFSHLWLSEGFATYMAHLYMENVFGTDSLKKRMITDRDTVLSFCRRISLPVVDSLSPYMALLNPNSYQKGGWILHMLRVKFGDQVFWNAIRKYYSRFQGQNASTEDLQKVFEEESRTSLDSFFNQWLYRPGLPVLTVTWHYDAPKQLIRIQVFQEQSSAFQFPLEMEIRSGHLPPQRKTFGVSEKNQTFTLSCTEEPETIVLDPDVHLLFDGKALKVSSP
jgi:aminopeptidase N